MTEHEINEKIRQACTHATPDVLDAVLSDCREQKGSVIMMTTNKKSKRWITRLAGIAACLCLIVGGVFGMRDYFINHAVDSTVSLDVNPSVEIRVNQKERVLDVIPLNSDGEIILDGMDFSGSDLNVAVNAMIGSMLQNGYLNELANSILISVDNDDPIRGTELQERLSAEVNKLLQTDKFSGSVLSQTVNRNDALKQMAEKYEITIGKAQLVQEILDEGSNHTFDELASLSINELNLLLRAEPTSKKHMDIVGTASDKAYIGEDKAKEIAIKKAGVSANNLTSYEIELDTYKGVMVYDVEFTSGNYEYDCEIDASTGNVVSFEKEYHGGPEFESNPGSNSDSNTVSTKSDSSQNGDSTLISKARAKEIALSHAGVSASNVTEFECKLDTDDGVKVYEVEFKAGNYEYDYEINASNGSIIDAERDRDD